MKLKEMVENIKYKITFGRFIHTRACLVVALWHNTSSSSTKKYFQIKTKLRQKKCMPLRTSIFGGKILIFQKKKKRNSLFWMWGNTMKTWF